MVPGIYERESLVRNGALKSLSVLSLTLAVLALAGCASSPESIEPLEVSDAGYTAMDCDQLTQKQADLGKELDTAAESQRGVQTGDAIGVVLVGLPVSTIAGYNVADKIAQLKGEIQALQRVAEGKNCHLTPINVLPPPPPKPTPVVETEFQ